MVHIIAIFLLFCVLTVINISKMHAKLVVVITASYTGSSPIVRLVSRYHVIQVKSDNGKGVYSSEGSHVIKWCMLSGYFLFKCSLQQKAKVTHSRNQYLVSFYLISRNISEER